MNTADRHLERQALLRRQAMAEAESLRREAYADFWRGADDLMAGAAIRARRSADRFLQSLRRHAQGRGLGGSGAR
jgi:hypothetical protein